MCAIVRSNMSRPSNLWRGQPLHFVSLALLLAATWWAWTQVGRPFAVAFWIAVSIPVLHQIFVWVAWRAELGWKGTSKSIGFNGYLAVFFALFLGRFAALAVLAWLDRGSLAVPLALQLVAVIALGAPGLYAMYSVHRYFGLRRAAGADHFDERYRSMPLVKDGIFRFTSNGMYLYAFLLFWAVGFALTSEAALIGAAFSHLYIWVHFVCTEKPDMESIYGED